MSVKEENIELMLKQVERIWKMYPDMRFGQLMFNLYASYSGRSFSANCYDYFHVEDYGFYEFLMMFKGWNAESIMITNSVLTERR